MPLRNPPVMMISESVNIHTTGSGKPAETVNADISTENVSFIRPTLLDSLETVDADILVEEVALFPHEKQDNMEETIDLAPIISEGAVLTII